MTNISFSLGRPVHSLRIEQCVNVKCRQQPRAVLPVYVCALSHFQLFVTLWTVARRAPMSIGFSRQEYYSGLPFPLPEDLPSTGTDPASLASPALAGGFFTTNAVVNHYTIYTYILHYHIVVQSLSHV